MESTLPSNLTKNVAYKKETKIYQQQLEEIFKEQQDHYEKTRFHNGSDNTVISRSKKEVTLDDNFEFEESDDNFEFEESDDNFEFKESDDNFEFEESDDDVKRTFFQDKQKKEIYNTLISNNEIIGNYVSDDLYHYLDNTEGIQLDYKRTEEFFNIKTNKIEKTVILSAKLTIDIKNATFLIFLIIEIPPNYPQELQKVTIENIHTKNYELFPSYYVSRTMNFTVMTRGQVAFSCNNFKVKSSKYDIQWDVKKELKGNEEILMVTPFFTSTAGNDWTSISDNRWLMNYLKLGFSEMISLGYFMRQSDIKPLKERMNIMKETIEDNKVFIDVLSEILSFTDPLDFSSILLVNRLFHDTVLNERIYCIKKFHHELYCKIMCRNHRITTQQNMRLTSSWKQMLINDTQTKTFDGKKVLIRSVQSESSISLGTYSESGFSFSESNNTDDTMNNVRYDDINDFPPKIITPILEDCNIDKMILNNNISSILESAIRTYGRKINVDVVDTINQYSEIESVLGIVIFLQKDCSLYGTHGIKLRSILDNHSEIPLCIIISGNPQEFLDNTKKDNIVNNYQNKGKDEEENEDKRINTFDCTDISLQKRNRIRIMGYKGDVDNKNDLFLYLFKEGVKWCHFQRKTHLYSNSIV